MKPLLFVIFGATGNLTYKKLIPALLQFSKQNYLPQTFWIVGIGRRDYTDGRFTDELAAHMSLKEEDGEWQRFKEHIRYFKFDFAKEEGGFDRLGSFLLKLPDAGGERDTLYYLATEPSFFPVIAHGLSGSGLLKKGDLSSKIIFEKPFGKNLKTAIEYNASFQKLLDEKQIFRIDHYLGKEMIQNILTVRFTNTIFESIWDRGSIENVKILSLESEGVAERAGYYDKTGAFSDMVQNHLLQTLCLVAMEKPKDFGVDEIRSQKLRVLERIRMSDDLLFGQYDGYLSENRIPPDSRTETLAAAKVFVDTPRWKNIPFYLVTGKKMGRKLIYVLITFREASSPDGAKPAKNKLKISVYPDEGISLVFNGKAPGLKNDIETVQMDYCRSCGIFGNTPEAYEKLLMDALNGDATLFTRWDEIESEWRIAERAQEAKKTLPLLIYKDAQEAGRALKDLWGEKVL
jgi:glucose-6-phosphate 1-dehydrogenase